MYGCFHVNNDRVEYLWDNMAHKSENIYYLNLYRRHFLIVALTIRGWPSLSYDIENMWHQPFCIISKFRILFLILLWFCHGENALFSLYVHIFTCIFLIVLLWYYDLLFTRFKLIENTSFIFVSAVSTVLCKQ